MKRINESAITSTVGFILEKKSLQHLQDSYTEALKAIQAIISPSYYTGTLVILSGCVMTGTNPGARTLSAGVVFYNGEIYQVPSASFTTTGSQIGIWTLTDVNGGTNESTLTDHSTVHALIDNKFIFAAGASASGTFDENSANVIVNLQFITSGLFASNFAFTGAATTAQNIRFRKKGNVLEFNLHILLTITNATLWNSSTFAFNTSYNPFNTGYAPFQPTYGEGVADGLVYINGRMSGSVQAIIPTTINNNMELDVYIPYVLTNTDQIIINVQGFYELA